MKLSDFVYPDIATARSVNLERDRGHGPALAGYQVTSKGCEILGRFIQALKGERISAWSLTGPYGMGKSAFANFLLACAGPSASKDTTLARKKLHNINRDLGKSLEKAIDQATDKKGFLRIPVTAGFEPVNRSIVSGVINALDNGQFGSIEPSLLNDLKSQWLSLSQHDHPESQSITKNLSTLQKKVKRPIIIVVDEFGKNLEYMAHHPDKGDIFVIQLLAETADIYLWVCLHQAFEGYAAGLTSQQRREWSKVQGRFEDISFIESTAQMLTLTRRVLVQSQEHRVQSLVNQWATNFIHDAEKAKIPLVKNMSVEEVASLYPLHPIAAAVLPELCRRFAQNDRTLFSFLCSGDPYALPQYLRNQDIGEHLPFVGLDYLYDYFFSVSTTAYINRPEAQRWIEIQDIINQAHTKTQIQQSILKAIGVLNLIAGPLGLPAKKSILQAALTGTLGLDHETLDKEIGKLSHDKALIYREYAQEYRLWEGSDFDIVGAIWKKRSSLATKRLEETLQVYCPLVPITASRHSYKKGTIRRFECRWMSIADLASDKAPTPKSGYDGLLVYAFGNQPVVKNLPFYCADKRPLLVAYAARENQIKELVLEAAAARAVLIESPELIHDGVAKKEARFRVQAAEDQLREYVSQTFTPSSQDTQWYIGSEIKHVGSHRDLSILVSKLCDEAYEHCPPIGNEMISYDQISGSAAAARRELAEAMVMNESEDLLKLSGYGPEVAVYRSLFRSTNLHINAGRKWKFVRPDPQKNKELSKVWEEIDRMLGAAQDLPYGLAVRAVIDRLKQPPFGMREGPIPLFICHYLIVNADEIALYQEGAYKPYFGDAEIALMIKRPELFSIRYYAPTGLGRDVVQAYLQVLNTDLLRLEANVRNPSLLKIITPLLQFMEGLPEYTRYTRSLSLTAQRLRGSILNAREPINLLFREIPESLGIEPISHNENPSTEWKSLLRDKLQEALLELNSAYEKLNVKIQDTLMEAFHWKREGKNQLHAFHESVKSRVGPIFKHCADPELKPQLGAILFHTIDDNEWVRGIAGRIVKKPVDAWRDGDFEPFHATIFEVADRIESLSLLVGSSIGLKGNQCLVFSVTRSDGRVKRRVIDFDENMQRQLKENYKAVFDAPQEIKEALCAMLTETLEKKDK